MSLDLGLDYELLGAQPELGDGKTLCVSEYEVSLGFSFPAHRDDVLVFGRRFR
jgi:hypothetical protein